MRYVVSGWVWFSTGVVAVLWLPWLALLRVLTQPFDPGLYSVGRWFRRAAVVSVALNPLWRFRTSGHRIPDPRRPYVVVSNHESYGDIFLLSHLPWEMKWLAKEELFRLPVMGWLMSLAGDIRVRRGSRRSRSEALEECRERLARQVSVMIFPEGTRSKAGELLPFHDGAFRLAVETGCPVLPVAVAGTRDGMPKGSFVFRPTVAEARVLEPIETAGLRPEDVPGLRERVRGLIAETRRELARELAVDA